MPALTCECPAQRAGAARRRLAIARGILAVRSRTNDVLAVDFSPDGKTLLMGYSGTEGCTVG
jgi:hypothetical protein